MIHHNIDTFKTCCMLRLLRTLVRNTYMHHLNEIFYTVENEYSPVGAAATPQAVRGKVFSDAVKLFLIPVKVSEALGDKLYIINVNIFTQDGCIPM